MSAVILLVSPIIDPSLLSDRHKWLDKSHGILDEMISRGNLIAGFRKSELQQLRDMLNRLPAHDIRPSLENDSSGFHQHQHQHTTGAKAAVGSEIQTGLVVDQDVFLGDTTIPEVDALSTAQLIALADSIESGDADWISNVVIEN